MVPSDPVEALSSVSISLTVCTHVSTSMEVRFQVPGSRPLRLFDPVERSTDRAGQPPSYTETISPWTWNVLQRC